MRSIQKWLQQLCVAAVLAFAGTSAHAFTFPATATYVRWVPDQHTGNAWSPAWTESWQATRNTVWRHCGEVLMSQGRRITLDRLVRCEREVASVNGRSPDSLGRLRVGERIILPLTDWQIAAYAGRTVPAIDLRALDERLQEVEQEVDRLKRADHITSVQLSDRLKDYPTRTEVEELLAESAPIPPARVLPEKDPPVWEEVAGSWGDFPYWVQLLILCLGILAIIVLVIWLFGAAAKSHWESFQNWRKQRTKKKEECTTSERVDSLENDVRTLKDEVGQKATADTPATGLHSATMGLAPVSRVHELEKRVDELEHFQTYLLERDAQGRFQAPGLTEEALNRLPYHESIKLVIQSVGAGAAHPHVEIERSEDANGPFLTLYGITPGVNRIDPTRKDGKPWFRITQIFRKIDAAIQNQQVVGISKAKKAA